MLCERERLNLLQFIVPSGVCRCRLISVYAEGLFSMLPPYVDQFSIFLKLVTFKHISFPHLEYTGIWNSLPILIPMESTSALLFFPSTVIYLAFRFQPALIETQMQRIIFQVVTAVGRGDRSSLQVFTMKPILLVVYYTPKLVFIWNFVESLIVVFQFYLKMEYFDWFFASILVFFQRTMRSCFLNS